MVRIEWRYTEERGDYKEDSSKNRGSTLIDADEKDGKVVISDLYDSLESFYEEVREPVQIMNIRQERI